MLLAGGEDSTAWPQQHQREQQQQQQQVEKALEEERKNRDSESVASCVSWGRG